MVIPLGDAVMPAVLSSSSLVFKLFPRDGSLPAERVDRSYATYSECEVDHFSLYSLPKHLCLWSECILTDISSPYVPVWFLHT